MDNWKLITFLFKCLMKHNLENNCIELRTGVGVVERSPIERECSVVLRASRPEEDRSDEVNIRGLST